MGIAATDPPWLFALALLSTSYASGFDFACSCPHHTISYFYRYRQSRGLDFGDNYVFLFRWEEEMGSGDLALHGSHVGIVCHSVGRDDGEVECLFSVCNASKHFSSIVHFSCIGRSDGKWATAIFHFA